MLSTGNLIYYNNPYKLIVEVDDDFGKYYRSLIPKNYKIRAPMYSPHITVLRNEAPLLLNTWEEHYNMSIEFEYDTYIHNYDVYFWLNVSCPLLSDIRIDLGLPKCSEFTRSPDSNSDFHITIGNIKHL